MSPRAPRFPPAIRAALAALFAATCAVFVPLGTAAYAADSPVSGGRLDWGVKASFQNYVTGPIANGDVKLTHGAATAGDSAYRFHSATGTYDPGSGDFSAAYSGGVRFAGHKQDNGSNELDLTIANPEVRIKGGHGTLYVDISDADGTSRDVPFGDLNVSGLNLSGGTTKMILNNVPVTLTNEGARSFAGYYEAGTALDPLSLTADMNPKQDKPSPSTKAEDGKFSGAAVDWGVRRTFREYVTGDIAKGTWTLSEGAQDGGALFRFGAGEGAYVKEKTLSATFAGAITFTGQGLDLTLKSFSVKVDNGKGALAADVTSKGVATPDVPLVTFAAKLAEKDGLVRLDEVSTVLTEEGAKAFGGLYPAGTEMDPLSLAVPVTSGAELPPLPDLGSEPTDVPSTTSAAPVSASQESGFMPAAYWIAAAIALAAVAAAFLFLKRRKASTPEPTPEKE